MAQLLVPRACSKLKSSIGDKAVVRLNFTGDLQEMLDALEVIQPLLEEAEMQMLDTNYRMEWLQHVNYAAYRIMAMVDELQDTTAPAAAVCAPSFSETITTNTTLICTGR
jgi:hypothetical protein